MRTTQIFFRNLTAILESRGLPLSWIEEKTGINEVFLSTFEWIASGLSFQLVIKIAIALNVSIASLVSEEGKITEISYGNREPKNYMTIYRRFWMAVGFIADRNNIEIYDIADAAGKTVAGIFGCVTRDKDIDIQRAEAIALHLNKTIDELIWQKIPESYPEISSIKELLASNF